MAENLANTMFISALSLQKRLAKPYSWFRAGEPRFNGFFSRDAYKTGIQVALLDTDPLRAALLFGAKYQDHLGNTPHQHFENLSEIPLGLRIFWGKPPYYNSIDAAAWFAIGLAEYVRHHTDDNSLLQQLWGNAKRAIARYLKDPYFQQFGLVTFRKKHFFDLTHQNWRDGQWNYFAMQKPIFPLDVQCLVYRALLDIAALSFRMDEIRYGLRLVEHANELRSMILKRFRWEKENYFYGYLHGKALLPLAAILPEPAYVAFTGIFDAQDLTGIFQRVLKKDLWTPFGVRSVATGEAKWFIEFPQSRRGFTLGSVWPHKLWMIWMGTEKSGHDTPALAELKIHLKRELELCLEKLFVESRIKARSLEPMPENIGHIFPEVVAVSRDTPERLELIEGANLYQAWTAGATIALTYHRIDNKFREMRVRE